MPVWLTIVASVIGIIGTIGGILGISAYFGERAKHKANLKNKQEDEDRANLEKMRHENYVKELRDIIRDELVSVNKDLKLIKTELQQNKKATITSLRSNMKQLRDQYRKQGYADAGDKATWNELFDEYKDMGGNHFKEYVNQWKQEVNELSNTRGSDKKTRLLEGKGEN